MEIIKPGIGYQNVHPLERTASVLGGIAIAASSIGKDAPTALLRLLAAGALVHRGMSGQCAAYRAFGVNTASASQPLPYEVGVRARASVTVAQSRDEIFAFWRDFENLPRFMRHLQSVDTMPDGKTKWKADGPAGIDVEWTAEIINEIPGELIAWKSLPGSQVASAGSVRFRDAPGGRGTEIRVELQYNPPAGIIGAYFARLFGREPEQEISADLQRLKQYLETGEVATTAGQSRGGRIRPSQTTVIEEVLA